MTERRPFPPSRAGLDDDANELAWSAAIWLYSTVHAACYLRDAKRRKSARRLDRLANEIAQLVSDEVGVDNFVAIMDTVAAANEKPPGRLH